MAKRFSPKKRATKRNIEHLDNDKPVIYKLMEGKKAVYVGIAKRGRSSERLEEHKKDKNMDFDSFAIKQVKTIDQAEREEKKLIKKYEFKKNKQHKK